MRVLLLPDPLAPTEPGKLGLKALMDLATIATSILSERQPTAEWRVEHDLARIPDDAECFQLSQVLGCMNGTSGLPMTFRVEQAEDGQRCVRRCLVVGEPDSDRFSADYQKRLEIADELLMEGSAAHDAGAEHHAGWAVKAADLVFAQLELALVSFQAARRDWHDLLAAPRPEYAPRYQIGADRPTGW